MSKAIKMLNVTHRNANGFTVFVSLANALGKHALKRTWKKDLDASAGITDAKSDLHTNMLSKLGSHLINLVCSSDKDIQYNFGSNDEDDGFEVIYTFTSDMTYMMEIDACEKLQANLDQWFETTLPNHAIVVDIPTDKVVKIVYKMNALDAKSGNVITYTIVKSSEGMSKFVATVATYGHGKIPIATLTYKICALVA